MIASELRPCDGCGGPLVPLFYRVRVQATAFDPDAVNRTLGLAQMFRGNLALAEAFSPDRTVTREIDPFELMICVDCACSKPLLVLLERRVAELDKAAR